MGQPGSLGEVVRAARIRAALTQRELCQRAGVSLRTVRDIEHGRVRQPRPESVRRLAVVVGLDPADALALSRRAPSARQRRGAADLEVAILGPLRVRRGGLPVVVGSLKQRCLLGLLALQPDHAVGHQELIDVLWGERPPPSCHNLVRTYVARLRRVLRPAPAAAQVIVAAAGGYRLALDGSQLDLVRFEALLAHTAQVRAANPAAALELLAEAVGCWRGPLLADLTDRMQQHPAAVAVAQRRLAAVTAYADLALELGHHQRAVEGLGPLAREEPLHEGIHARLMLALAGSGQQAAALEVFTELRGRLAGELGVEPGPELQEAQARVLRGDLPAPPPPSRGPAQLPADVAGFTGRAELLERLDRLLPADGEPAATAVAITAIGGMAGVGKTALAIHWGHRVRDRFPDGQLYVSLRGWAAGPPVSPLEALARLLRGLGVPAGKVPVGVEEAAALYRSLLSDRRVLVVLDNARDAEQVRPLLPGSPGCLVVVTSRDRLTGLVASHGAQRLALRVLTATEALGLLERILSRERVAAEPRAALELAEVCGMLPLALRIAAANLAALPEQAIATYVARLRRGDRLGELAVEGDPRAAVRAAFDQSYRDLPAGSRRLFRLLGLVPGPDVSVPAAAALGAIAADAAGRLLDGLIGAHLAEPRGPGRVGLHDLLRLYAREQAEREDPPAEREAALERLLDWYLRTADAAARLLYPEALRLPAPAGPSSDAVPPPRFDGAAGAVAWLDGERANLVAAVQQLAQHGPHPVAWRLADALRGYFWQRGLTVEWLVVARAGLAAAIAAQDVRAQAASRLGLGAALQAAGGFIDAIQQYTDTVRLAHQAGWSDGQAAALSSLGLAYWWSGDLRQAADHHTRALALCRRSGWLGGQASALLYLGLVDRALGRLEAAAEHHARALALFGRLGSRDGEALALGNLGEAAHDLGRLDHAQRHLSRALTLMREAGDRFGQANVLRALAAVHRDAGRHPRALEAAEAALTLATEIEHHPTEVRARNTLASIHLRLGRTEQGIQQYDQALALARRCGIRASAAGALLGLAAAFQQAGQPTRALDHAGQALPIAGQAGFKVLEGQAHTALAVAHQALGHHDQAGSEAERALDLHRRSRHQLGQARTLHVLGLVLRDSGDTHAARTCWQEALALFSGSGSPEAATVRGLLNA